MEKFRTAFASNDGNSFNKEHFGDSNYYHLYDISESEVKFIKKISNNTKDIIEERHADPKKAKGVSEMLKDEQVQVVVSGVFGPNIKRINKHFVCIIFMSGKVQDSLVTIQENFQEVRGKWELGENRDHLVF
ncbi:dinitrogenase iron-molybdenum cofactor biosynthesis protein [bacterium]|nr:dinitrogenase iron-molybdenum cofactor biosynthesis protein [bacterium]